MDNGNQALNCLIILRIFTLSGSVYFRMNGDRDLQDKTFPMVV
jgi:hypothetical protein